MLENESVAAARRIPLDLDDGAGAEYTGTAPTGSEVLISISGSAFATASGTVTKLRNGDFYYEATQAETRGRGFRLLRLAKSGMGTAVFEWYVGSRRASDADAVARRIPIMLELSGAAVTGITLTGSEIEISVNGAAFATGTGTATEIGYGAYYYQPPASELSRGYSLLNVNDSAADEYKYELIIDQEYWPTLAGTTTTAESIRERIVTVIEDLTPTSLTGDLYREFRNETTDFVEWCENSPAGALRRFQARYSGNDDPPETSSVLETEHQRDFTVWVAYPRTARYGADQSLDRDDVIDEDRKQILRAIGMLGKPNFTSPYPAATWLSQGENVDRTDGAACDFLQIVVRLAFIESLA